MRLKRRVALTMSIAVLMVGGGTAATFATSGYFGSSGSSSHHEYKHKFILKACAFLKVHHYYLWKLLCKPYLYGHGHWHGHKYGYDWDDWKWKYKYWDWD